MERVDLETYVPDFHIKINGVDQPGIRDAVESLSINEQIGVPSQFNIVLADKFSIKTQKLLWLEEFLSFQSPLFESTKKIEISMGYVGKLVKMVTGILENITTSGFSASIPTLTLEGHDSSSQHLKDNSLVEGSAKNLIKIEKNDTYSDIAKKIAKAADLTPEIDETKKYRQITIKKSITFLDFLNEAARRIGYDFFTSRDSLFFINPKRLRKSQKETMTFTWNVNLIEFNPTINISELRSEIEMRGYTSNSRTLVTKKISAGQEDVLEKGKTTASQIAAKKKNKKMEITNMNFETEQEAEDIIKSEFNKISDKLITGRCSIIGNPNLVPGHYVKLAGLGDRLSGMYYVTSVTNTIGGNGYSTTFNVTRNVM